MTKENPAACHSERSVSGVELQSSAEQRDGGISGGPYPEQPNPAARHSARSARGFELQSSAEKNALV